MLCLYLLIVLGAMMLFIVALCLVTCLCEFVVCLALCTLFFWVLIVQLLRGVLFGRVCCCFSWVFDCGFI